MKNQRTVAAVGILVVALLATSVALPMVATGAPANQVSVTDMPEAGDALADPADGTWEDAESTEVPLASAPSGLPNAGSVATDAVDVEAVRTESTLYVRMTWDDDTMNASTNDTTAFADAAAMQIPANETSNPDIALGSQDTPVNVWYWNAAEGTEEIVAGGQGTITEVDQPAIESQAVHEDGTWTVVMERSLSADAENRAALDTETDVDVAFAVWDGANGERSGHHAVSEWFTYPFGPADTGPAIQYLFWAIAGIAIAIALVVTVMAIRRTRQP
ncbi:MAG: ethylbenzene dehydrogenase-related protein [archaeon]